MENSLTDFVVIGMLKVRFTKIAEDSSLESYEKTIVELIGVIRISSSVKLYPPAVTGSI